jgi:hypothetical protein
VTVGAGWKDKTSQAFRDAKRVTRSVAVRENKFLCSKHPMRSVSTHGENLAAAILGV